MSAQPMWLTRENFHGHSFIYSISFAVAHIPTFRSGMYFMYRSVCTLRACFCVCKRYVLRNSKKYGASARRGNVAGPR